MEKDTKDAVVDALIAASVLQRESTRKKSSSSSGVKSKTSGKSSTVSGKQPKEPAFVPLTGNSTAKTTSADTRLSQFMSGELPMIQPDGTKHFYDPDAGQTYTLQEISDVMGVTRERVRQIEQSGLKKMFASFSSVARREGLNPIDWSRQLFTEIESRKGGEEHDVDYGG